MSYSVSDVKYSVNEQKLVSDTTIEISFCYLSTTNKLSLEMS